MSASFPKLLNAWCFHRTLSVFSVHTEQMYSAVLSADQQQQACSKALDLSQSPASQLNLLFLGECLINPDNMDSPWVRGPTAPQRCLQKAGETALHVLKPHHTEILTWFGALHVGLPIFKLFHYSQILQFKRCSVIQRRCLKQTCWNALKWNKFLNTISQLYSCPN